MPAVGGVDMEEVSVAVSVAEEEVKLGKSSYPSLQANTHVLVILAVA